MLTIRNLRVARGLAFDQQGRLFVVELLGNIVQVFSILDHQQQQLSHEARVLFSFGESGTHGEQLWYPSCIAIDDELDHILVSNAGNNRMILYSLSDHSFIRSIGRTGHGADHFHNPFGVCIDSEHRILIADSSNNRIRVLSCDGESLFSFGEKGSLPRHFIDPTGVCVDRRRRIIVADRQNNRIQAFTHDGEFLLSFGENGSLPGHFIDPTGVCVDNQDRIIVADTHNLRLQAFTLDGELISIFQCPTKPLQVAFDPRHNLIAFSSGQLVYVLPPNHWLEYYWQPSRHHLASNGTKRLVETVTILRSVALWSSIALLPNELLFEIFSFL